MIKKLVDKIVETNAPIVVGLDPMMKYLPKHLADVHLSSMVRHLREQQRLYGSITKAL